MTQLLVLLHFVVLFYFFFLVIGSEPTSGLQGCDCERDCKLCLGIDAFGNFRNGVAEHVSPCNRISFKAGPKPTTLLKYLYLSEIVNN